MVFGIIKRAASGVVLPPIRSWRSLLGGADTACMGGVVLPAGEAKGLAEDSMPRLRERVGLFCDERLLAYDTHLARLCATCFVFRILFQRMDAVRQSTGQHPHQ